jgi:uncharacterized protein YeaO (DUF488 family)
VKVLEVFTIQISRHRLLRRTDIEFFDCTVKSGDKIFAPTTELLWAYKCGHLTAAEYTDRYYRLCRQRFRKDPQPWLALLGKGRVALACYCRDGAFCHRHLLVDILEKLCRSEGIRFYYGGEVTV